MNANQVKSAIKVLHKAADAIATLDEDVIDALICNGVDVPTPQELNTLASALGPLLRGEGFASATVLRREFPDAKIIQWRGNSFAPGKWLTVYEFLAITK